jgi:hypothetical protein
LQKYTSSASYGGAKNVILQASDALPQACIATILFRSDTAIV